MDSWQKFYTLFLHLCEVFSLSFLEKSKKNVVLLTDTKIPLRER